MDNPSLEILIELLNEALAHPGRRQESIEKFQASMWKKPPYTAPAAWIQEILGDLAYDLDFYEPDLESRQEDPSYFGDDQAEEKIRSALLKLKAGGIPVPNV